MRHILCLCTLLGCIGLCSVQSAFAQGILTDSLNEDAAEGLTNSEINTTNQELNQTNQEVNTTNAEVEQTNLEIDDKIRPVPNVGELATAACAATDGVGSIVGCLQLQLEADNGVLLTQNTQGTAAQTVDVNSLQSAEDATLIQEVETNQNANNERLAKNARKTALMTMLLPLLSP